MIVKTTNSNNYLYSHKNSTILYLHPLLVDVDNNSLFEIEDSYYRDKYDFLRNHICFNQINKNEFNYNLTSKEIENLFFNANKISFEVTRKCNLDCTYCINGKFYNKLNTPNGAKKIDDSKAIKLLKELNNKWSLLQNKKQVTIDFYGGEPLLNIKFIKKIIKYLKNNVKNIDFVYSMTTNGTLLIDNIEFLVNNNFIIYVSLDGNKTNNVYRVDHKKNETFDQVMFNIENIRENYPHFFKKNIFFNSVLHNKNSGVEILSFFKKQFNKDALITELGTANLDNKLKKEFDTIFEPRLNNHRTLNKDEYELFSKIKTSNTSEIIRSEFNNHSFNKNKFLSSTDKAKYLPTATCTPFSHSIFLTCEGYVLPCEKINHNFHLGYILRNKLYLNFSDISKRYNDYYKNISKSCTSCYAVKFCKTCIFDLNINDKKVKCKNYLNRNEFLSLLSHGISSLEEQTNYRKSNLQNWLYIEPYVYINVVKNDSILYNTITKKILLYENNSTIAKLLNPINFNNYLIEISEDDLIDIKEFIFDIRNLFFGDLIKKGSKLEKTSTKAPIIKIPPKSLSEDIENYKNLNKLSEISFYLNNKTCFENLEDVSILKNIHKQFHFSLAEETLYKEIEIDNITKILSQVKKMPLKKINIISGNIFKYDKIKDLIENLKEYSFDIKYYLYYYNLYCNIKDIELFKDSEMSIGITFPIKKKYLKILLDKLNNENFNYKLSFVITDRKDFEIADDLIKHFKITRYEFKPYYLSKNKSYTFFRENVFPSKKNLLNSQLTLMQLNLKKHVNRNFLGKFSILPNGDFFSNINHKSLGNVLNNSIENMIEMELLVRKNWKLTKSNLKPCANCIFNILCPNISNYEFIIGKNNLCTILK